MEMEKIDALDLGSLSVDERSGLGLPYAPVDWPNPGDVWTWKVGKRTSGDGFYRDRFLFPPSRLRREGRRKYFNSKKSIVAYLKTEFPEADIDAFFRSFTWKIYEGFKISPEKVDKHGQSTVDKRGALCSDAIQSSAQVPRRPRNPRPKSKKVGENVYVRKSWRLVTSKASSKQRVRFTPKEVNEIIELSSWSNGIISCELTGDNSKSATDSENIRALSSQSTGSQSSKDGTYCHLPKEITSQSNPDDSDMLIDSADSLLSQPLPKSSDAGPVNDKSATSLEMMFEAQIKLLLLLATDIPGMHSSIKLPKIRHLRALLKTDPNIDATRHGILKLKLIDEVPLAWKEFLENMKIPEVADKFSEDLKTNIARATTLENEYNEAKGYEYILRKELDSITLNMKKIDEQFAALQSRRDELATAADAKKKVVDMWISKQKNAAECFSKVVHEVFLKARIGAERENV